MKKELKDLKEIDKEFMTKVLSKLEIQAENAAMQSQKITKLDTVETSLENLSVVVSRQGKSLNDTAVLLNDHTFQITNLSNGNFRVPTLCGYNTGEHSKSFFFVNLKR